MEYIFLPFKNQEDFEIFFFQTISSVNENKIKKQNFGNIQNNYFLGIFSICKITF